jgi:integrase
LTLDDENPLEMFLYALRAPESKRQYPRRLKIFLDYLTNKGEIENNNSLEEQAKEFLIKTKENPKWANGQLMEFILFQKHRAERGEIVFTTIRNYLKATKLFLDMNCEVPLLNWKRIIKGLPSPKNTANDRAATLEEIRKLIEYPDRRIKPIILSMVSGGFRIRSRDYLQWKHVTPITNDKTKEIIAAKTVIYAGEPEEYYCFITPEAYHALSEWMEFSRNFYIKERTTSEDNI